MNELEQLESKLSQIRAPQMPSEVEARIRARLSAKLAAPPASGPLAGLTGLFTPGPAFAAQAALLAALLAIAAALFVHDAHVIGASATSLPAVSAPASGGSSGGYSITFMVPTVKSGTPSAPSGPPVIAPPAPPPRHHR